MTMVRGLLALLVLPFLMIVPAAAADIEWHHGGYGNEHCAVATEEMDMIFIRLKPTNYARIEKRLTAGDCGIDLTGGCDDGWCPVQQGRFDGWMHRDQLVAMSPPTHCVTRVKQGWVVDLHEGPSASMKIIVSLGDRYCGIALTPFRVGPWVRVNAGGHYGWVKAANID